MGLVLAIAVAALAMPAAAFGQDPTSAQYNTPVTEVVSGTGGGGGGDGASPGGSETQPGSETAGLRRKVGGLPFTGLDVVALLAVALALASVGFALQRMSASRPL